LLRLEPRRLGILPVRLLSLRFPFFHADRYLNRADKEQVLLSNARDGIQLLVNEIWSQPTRIVEEGVVADLPPIATGLPREKPVRPFPSFTPSPCLLTQDLP
jgi:hypothetical protein